MAFPEQRRGITGTYFNINACWAVYATRKWASFYCLTESPSMHADALMGGSAYLRLGMTLILTKCSLFLSHTPDVCIFPLSSLTFHVIVPPSFIYFMIFSITYWQRWLSTHGAWHTWSTLKLLALKSAIWGAPLTGFLEMTPKKLPWGHMMVCVAWCYS